MTIPKPRSNDASDRRPLQLLCLIARLHRLLADPKTLAHQLAISDNAAIDTDLLQVAAKKIGLKAALTKVRLSRLQTTPLPAMAQMSDGRWAIVCGCDADLVLVQYADNELAAPDQNSIQPQRMSKADFATAWLGDTYQDSGELLLFTSRADIAGEWARFDISWFVPSLVRYRKLFGEVLLVSCFLQLFALVTPLFFQVVMDKVLVHNGVSTLNILVTGLVASFLFDSLLSFLRTYVFSHTTSRIDVELGSRLFRHLLHLPLSYFQSRRVGDSVARVRELENIRSFLTGQALTVVLDVLFSIIFIAVMFCYSVVLTTIVLISIPCYIVLSLLVIPVLRKRLQEKICARCREPVFTGGDY